MAKHKFKITLFKNPSGVEVFRLSGTLNGKRIRENHSSREAAKSARQDYEIKLLNDEPEGRTLWTTLSPEENRDAVSAISMLKSQSSAYSLTLPWITFFVIFVRLSARKMLRALRRNIWTSVTVTPHAAL